MAGLTVIDAILHEGDAALYLAKAQGRNRCVLAHSMPLLADAASRRKVFKGGRILFNRRDTSRNCTVRNIGNRRAGARGFKPGRAAGRVRALH